MAIRDVLIAGKWRAADSTGTFHATNPITTEPLAEEFPVSSWADCDAALDAAVAAHRQLGTMPEAAVADFLEAYATAIEARAESLVAAAHAETALPTSPRLADVELPRTTGQLRQAAAAARDGSWRAATIDTKANIRSQLASIGPVCVFGPNNFPFAFGSISGGDFAAAIAAGNPVIAKANSSHPETTRIFAEAAHEATQATGMPDGMVQLIYRTSHADGERLVADRRVGATGYTGSRTAGMKLKAAADAVGKPIYLELSSVNPVVILPGALDERGDDLSAEFSGACLMGAGQFCTNPGMVMLIAGESTERFLTATTERFSEAAVGTLLSAGVGRTLSENLGKLIEAGATKLVGGTPGGGTGFSHANTLLRISASKFMEDPDLWQTEAFGNASLMVVADDAQQAALAIDRLEGNLTGCIYSDSTGKDDAAYDLIEPRLRPHVGRLLNDKMPTGVAVSRAMNHGGPFPATGHPAFTAVGIPAALTRFAMLQCYDAVRESRLPPALRDKTPNGTIWRDIDGTWTQGDAAS